MITAQVVEETIIMLEMEKKSGDRNLEGSLRQGSSARELRCSMEHVKYS